MTESTHFGNESVMDLRLIKIGSKSMYQRKVMTASGETQWIDVSVAAENLDTDEFAPHTDVSKKAESCAFDKFDKSDTIFKPNDHRSVNTDVLIKKSIQDLRNTIIVDKHLLQDYMDRLIMLHAILIRITGTSPETLLAGHETNMDKLKKNSALREAVLLLIDVVGEPWTSVKGKI